VDQTIPDREELKRSHFEVVEGDLDAYPAAAQPEGATPNEATLSALYAENPYESFDVEPHPEDLQGWNSYVNVFRDVIEAVQPRRIVEVGVWKGTASIHMAKIVRDLGLRCEVICVDTWLGSPEHLLAGHDGERYRSLKLRNGYPQLFYTFLSNVIRNGVSDYVVPLPCTSESAAVVLRKLGLEADVIHIDAAHEYEPALRDFHVYWDLLSARGVLIGDDYIAKRSVTRAAAEFAAAVGRPLCGLFPKFVIARPEDVEFGIIAR
jgi:predicted O-methyltransferase YrrM